jgi:hypothetical protein
LKKREDVFLSPRASNLPKGNSLRGLSSNKAEWKGNGAKTPRRKDAEEGKRKGVKR